MVKKLALRADNIISVRPDGYDHAMKVFPLLSDVDGVWYIWCVDEKNEVRPVSEEDMRMLLAVAQARDPKVRDPEEALAQDGWRYATGDEYEAAKHRALHSNRQLAERTSIGCP